VDMLTDAASGPRFGMVVRWFPCDSLTFQLQHLHRRENETGSERLSLCFSASCRKKRKNPNRDHVKNGEVTVAQ
jgi:hypothetical protein